MDRLKETLTLSCIKFGLPTGTVREMAMAIEDHLKKKIFGYATDGRSVYPIKRDWWIQIKSRKGGTLVCSICGQEKPIDNFRTLQRIGRECLECRKKSLP